MEGEGLPQPQTYLQYLNGTHYCKNKSRFLLDIVIREDQFVMCSRYYRMLVLIYRPIPMESLCRIMLVLTCYCRIMLLFS